MQSGLAESSRRPRWFIPVDMIRGFFIGLAELVPGVSGGTVALVTGVYDELINSASHVISAVKKLVVGPDRVASAVKEFKRTDWWLVVPVLVGMATAVLTVAGVMEQFVTTYPEYSRGLFFGLVATSIVVPLRMLPTPSRRPWFVEALFLVGAAALAWFLIGMAGGGSTSDPSLVVVFVAAAIAICALVLPGVSGSFFLLAIGLYSATLGAVHERNLGYLAVFAAGALFGLASFVQLLRYLLSTHRRSTLLVMAGLMLGSLRALWPWQTPDGDGHGPGALAAPYAPIGVPVLLALAGAVVVGILIWVEWRAERTEQPVAVG